MRGPDLDLGRPVLRQKGSKVVFKRLQTSVFGRYTAAVPKDWDAKSGASVTVITNLWQTPGHAPVLLISPLGRRNEGQNCSEANFCKSKFAYLFQLDMDELVLLD